MKINCLYDTLLPVAECSPHPKNRNKHPKDQIKRLAEILKYQGWRYPIKISNRSHFVTSGHGRIEAARFNGWDTVPVNFQDYDSEEQEYADVQADNAIASWAELDLSGINADIGDLGPDFNIDLLGLKDFVLEPADKLAPGCDEDDVPEKVEPRTKLGDLYQLGNHRLLCGDSTNIQHVERLMGGEKADITFTSPPYNVASTPGGTNPNIRYRSKEADDKSHDEYKDLLCGFFSSAITVSKFQYVNLGWLEGNKRALIEWLYQFRSKYVDIAFWDKGGSNISPNEVLNSRAECVFIFSCTENPNRSVKIDKPLPKGAENLFTIDSSRVGNKDTFGKSGLNSAKFPVEFVEHFINLVSPKSIFDPFGGSGSTLIACEKTNRKCFMMELDPHYCDVIVSRWEKYSGKKAELLDGETTKTLTRKRS